MERLTSNRLLQGIILGCIVGVGLLMMLNGGLFRSFQLLATNMYFVPRPVSDNVVLVAIDDETLQQYGRSPAEWSRSTYADLVDILSVAGARVIAFDLLFTEAGDGDERFAAAIEQARLGENRTRTVLAAAGALNPLPLDYNPRYPQGLHYSETLTPITALHPLVDNIGFVNALPDVDSALRRLPSIIQYEEQVGVSFSLATYLAFLRIPTAAIPQVLTAQPHNLLVTPERAIPIDDNGQWLINYYGGTFFPGSRNISTILDGRCFR